MTSLLKQRDMAMRRLDRAVKNLEDCLNFSMNVRAPAYVRACKRRAKYAKNRYNAIERKLFKINNHAITPRLEFLAKLMVIFKPEIKEEIEKIVTFT